MIEASPMVVPMARRQNEVGPMVVVPNAADVSLAEVVARDLGPVDTANHRIGSYLIADPAGFIHKPIQEIARAAQVSEPSVVRFCRRHGFKGMADFRIALAMSLARSAAVGNLAQIEPQVADKAGVNLAAKRAIGKLAISLLANDRTIIVGSGSTTQFFAEYLRDAAGLVIMTTGLNIVQTLKGGDQHTVMLTGGRIRYDSNSVVGRMVETTLSNMRFDTLYLGADSIDPRLGLSTFNEAEAHQNVAMMDACSRVVVLADSSKFRAPELHRFCTIDRIDAIVTDTGLPQEYADQITAHGVSLLLADPDENPA